MWVKVTYDGSQGSVCPLCGTPLYYHYTEVKKIYSCFNKHLVFVETKLVETKDDYILRTDMYVYHQEWKSYIESIWEIYRVIVPTNLLINEDVIWQHKIRDLGTRLKNGLKSN